jgi:hypothetical protein
MVFNVDKLNFDWHLFDVFWRREFSFGESFAVKLFHWEVPSTKKFEQVQI